MQESEGESGIRKERKTQSAIDRMMKSVRERERDEKKGKRKRKYGKER